MTAGSSDPAAIVVLGGGGHARVAVDACRAAGLTVAGVLDRRNPPGGTVLGAPWLGDDEMLDRPDFIAAHRFLIGIGEQTVRRRLDIRLDAQGARLATVIHPAAWVSDHAALGPGTLVVGGTVVNAGARIGRSAILNTGCSADHDVLLEERCHVGPGARLAGGVRCGADVVIGTGAVLLPGVSVGGGSVVGAGAVVIRDLPPGVTAAGNPARLLRDPRRT